MAAVHDPKPNAHQIDDAEAERRIDEIARRALAELRAIDPGCDCTVLHGVRVLLALGLDERVIHEDDAGAALDLVRYLELLQAVRRDALGLDRHTTDGPLAIPTAIAAPVVRVHVRPARQWMPLDAAIKLLDPDDEDTPEIVQ